MSLTTSAHWMYNPGGGLYGYEIDNSLRFDSNSGSYLERNFPSTGNTRTFTVSYWFKRSRANINEYLFAWGSSVNDRFHMDINTSGTFQIEGKSGGSTQVKMEGGPVLRDVSSWYHFVLRVDTTQSTASNRVRLYVNGELLTFNSNTYPSQNAILNYNNNGQFRIGRAGWATNYFQGYMANFISVDGQSLDPTSFGENKSGIWIPKEYSGSYGTNGFKLEFNGNANDTSGNGNNFTANNISSHDYMLDSPTNNFCVMNSLHKMWYKNMSQGGLRVQAIGSVTPPYASTYVGTIGVRTGKWYWEYRLNTHNNGNVAGFIRNGNLASDGSYPRDNSVDRIFGINNWDNAIYVGSSAISKSFNVNGTAGDIMGITYDADNNTFSLYKNGSFVGTSATNSLSLGPGEHALPMMTTAFWDNQMHLNFGQDSTFAGATTAGGNADENGYGDFKYAPPSGYLAICTANLPSGAIDTEADETPEDYFNTVLFDTQSGSYPKSITGVGFQPDLVWAKSRTQTYSHYLFDVVRGTGVTHLSSNSSSAEGWDGTTDLDSFDADGFTVGAGDAIGYTNGVAWNWKAGGSGVSNTDGSITSTVSVGATSQQNWFSIVDFTGAGAAGTVGHGLGVIPSFIVYKRRNASGDSWIVYHDGISSSENGGIYLNLTNAWNSDGSLWNNTAPTSSVFSVGTYGGVSGENRIAYCFANAEGLCKVGSYTGNGSTDGTVVYTGFRPAFVLIKPNSSGQSWFIHDSTRDPINWTRRRLFPNTSAAENGSEAESTYGIDFCSNGFKIRASHTSTNISGVTHIYMAFAEQPFKYANAR